MADANQEFQDKIKALRDEYEAKLPGRLRELDACFKQLPPDDGAGESRQELENLMVLAHKLSGSAGTFGFTALGVAAEKLENACQAYLDESGGLPSGGHGELAGLLAAVLGVAEKGSG